MKAKLACVSFLVASIAACSGPTDPRADAGTARGPIDQLPSLEFSAWPLQPGTDPNPPLDAAGGPGRIAVQGSVGTPYPCYDFEAFVEREASRVALDVVATRQPVPCIAVLARFGYTAMIRDLAPGDYTVTVAHVVDGEREEVLEAAVTVH
jgi:hypothetical protein